MSLKTCTVRIAKFEPYTGVDADATPIGAEKLPEFDINKKALKDVDYVSVGFHVMHNTSRRTLYRDVIVKTASLEKKTKEAIVGAAWVQVKDVLETWAEACADFDSVVGLVIDPYGGAGGGAGGESPAQ
jgi:hypothetical protein